MNKKTPIQFDEALELTKTKPKTKKEWLALGIAFTVGGIFAASPFVVVLTCFEMKYTGFIDYMMKALLLCSSVGLCFLSILYTLYLNCLLNKKFKHNTNKHQPNN